MCERVDLGDGNFAIVCAGHRKRQRCRWCSEYSVALCDHSVGPNKTCDAPMCENHRKPIGPNQDLCPEHADAMTRGPMAPPPAHIPIEWPTTRHKLQLAGYHMQYARPCKLCAAPIEFWKTPARPGRPGSGGKLIPLDRRPDDTFMPHWATCPHAEEFRKKQKSVQGDLFG